jgi:hypothetical protein
MKMLEGRCCCRISGEDCLDFDGRSLEYVELLSPTNQRCVNLLRMEPDCSCSNLLNIRYSLHITRLSESRKDKSIIHHGEFPRLCEAYAGCRATAESSAMQVLAAQA